MRVAAAGLLLVLASCTVSSSGDIAVDAGVDTGPATGSDATTSIGTTTSRPAAAPDRPFQEIADEVGLTFVHATPFSEADYTPAMSVAKMISGAAAADFDGDGDTDIFLVGGGTAADGYFLNDGTGHFTDYTDEAGVAGSLHLGTGTAVGDYDKDGDMDLFVASHGTPLDPTPGKHRLFRNNGDGTFTDVAAEAGVAMTGEGIADGFGAVFGDIDLDGDLDLFVAGWEKDNAGSRLFRNNGDGTFTDITDEAGIVDDGIRGFSPCLVDTDGDFYPELLLVADFGTSRYFINDADGTFSEATTTVGAGLEWSGMGTAIGDVNNDGLVDWYSTAIYDIEAAGRGDGNKLYLNRGAHRFDEVATAAGVADGGWGWGTVTADLDHDGWLDIAEVNGWHFEGFEAYTDTMARLFMSNGDGTFTDRAAEAGFDHQQMGLGMMAFDIENDGDLDLAVTSPNDRFSLYRNSLADGNWLRVQLNTFGSPGLSPNGVGARVTVDAGGMTLTRNIAACANYLTSVQPEAHFGVGKAAEATVTVEWPDGSVTESTVDTNQILILTP